MNTYRVWHLFTRVQCVVPAPSSFEARKQYAALYGVDYRDCAARRIWNDEEA